MKMENKKSNNVKFMEQHSELPGLHYHCREIQKLFLDNKIENLYGS